MKEDPQKIYGLIGFPVKHSLSPAMHNAAFSALKINAEYRLFEVRPEELSLFLDRLDASNIFGLNVTIPHKESLLGFVKLDSESSYLRQIRAVNTIIKKDLLWKGFNTDIPGFSRHLKENFNPVNKRAAILGAGGAARAVAYVLAQSAVKEIAIFDIDRAKTEGATQMIKGLFPAFSMVPVESIEQLDIKDKDLLVNATPIGMKEADPCLVEEGMLHKDLFVYDLIYNPGQTKLLKLAQEKGCRYANGLGMLLYQGMLSFEYFSGQDAPEEVMRKALEEAVRKI